jgi:hypothetical protein
MTFALPKLDLPATRRAPVDPQRAPAAAPALHPAHPLEEPSRPVSAAFRDLTIPGVVPAQRSSWRGRLRIRGRAS